jgi:hypothetical protein
MAAGLEYRKIAADIIAIVNGIIKTLFALNLP